MPFAPGCSACSTNRPSTKSGFNNSLKTKTLDEDLLREDDPVASQADGTPPVDYALVREELAELDEYLRLARNIREDQKSHALLSALQQGFERMGAMGAARKAVIFTESRRTQDYLARYLRPMAMRASYPVQRWQPRPRIHRHLPALAGPIHWQ